jgi:2-haloacid dehalogenase
VTEPLPSADRPVSPDGPQRPALVIFDVNETLSDMAPMADRFADVGAPAQLARSWFAGLLRDGFTLSLHELNPTFAHLGTEALRAALHGQALNRELDDAVSYIMDGFGALRVHPDVPEGVAALTELGIRLVTLSNGSASVADRLLEESGIRHHFERLLSVEDARVWKPAAPAYEYALTECGVAGSEAMLVAAHPWDTDGACRAGLSTAFVNRIGAPYPSYFEPPTVEAQSLVELAEKLR